MAMQRLLATEVNRRIAAGQVRLALAVIMLFGSTASLAEAPWPVVAIPRGIEPFDMGGEMTVNGLPLRMQGLLSAKSPAQVAALLRASMGQPLVEDTQGTKLVLGRSMGEFYATVQLEPAGSGTRGLVAVTRLRTAIDEHAKIKDEGRRVLSRFPSGSRLVSRTNSINGNQRDEYLVLSNAHSPEFNVESVKRTLGAEGYSLERMSTPGHVENTAPIQPGGGATLQFKRSDGEAVAVIYREAGGGTAIVLNTVTFLEHAK
ncbi:hypothetical protein CSQ96_27645 [Janthinobacterium sp. BJB412]|nr:hypothetical protein CSQ96_27645 [Janthinobacterium sp. BJB412]